MAITNIYDETLSPEPTIECPICHGAGHYQDYVMWSDGLGGVEMNCYLCDATGRLDDTPAQLALRYKRQLAELAQQHRRFVIATACYLKTRRGELPDPPFADAPSPSSYPEHHLEAICKEVKTLPRLQPGACGHADPATCRENVEKYPTSYQDAVCRVTLGLPQLAAAQRRPS